MLKISTLTNRARFIGAAVVLAGVSAFSALSPMLASAGQFTERSLALSSSAPNEVATYTFTFTPTETTAIQSWGVMFCDTAFGYLNAAGTAPLPYTGTPGSGDTAPCAIPGGATPANQLDASGATNAVVRVNGSPVGTWSVAGGSNKNVILISSADGGTGPGPMAAGAEVSISLDNIKNPGDIATYTSGNFENTFFGYTRSYSDTAQATMIDEGTVASAIVDAVNITARVQETLKFSVGATGSAAGAACDALTGATTNLTLGDTVNGALASDQAYETSSYFRVSTNSAVGTDIQYAGATLTSGTNTIDPITVSASATGTEQFGLALNTDDAAHSFTDLEAAADYADGAGTITNGGTAIFNFDANSETTPVAIASSEPATPLATGTVSCDTGAVRYIANIRGDTEAGIYRTSINYIAVPKY